MKSCKNRRFLSRSATYQIIVEMRLVIWKLRSFTRTANEMHETLGRMHEMMKESNQNSVKFWAQYMKDFPNPELDPVILKYLSKATN